MKIIVSNTSHGAYRGVLGEIAANSDKRCIVLAPDRFTASVERGLISSLGLKSTFGLEVMSFTRLASRLMGKDLLGCLTPEGSVMLIGKVIADCLNAGELTYYNRSALTDGFASELYAALTAIRNSGISSDTLENSAEMFNPAMKAKLKDIAAIYKGYLAALEGRRSDSTTRLEALAEFVDKNPSCTADICFFSTDIYDFSVPELDVLRALAKRAYSLTVGVTSGYDNPNRRIYPDRMLNRLVNLTGDAVEIVRNDEELPEPIATLSTRLFSYASPAKKAENGGKISIRRAADRTDEVTALALDVLEHVQNGGRYKDFEVFAPELSDYAPTVKQVFARYGIPFFIDSKEPLVNQTKTRYLMQAIACVRSGFARREVLEFVKNPLFALRRTSEDSVFVFENYVLKYNVDHSRFLSSFTLCETDRKGQKKKFKYAIGEDKAAVSEYDECEVPEQVRMLLTSELVPLLDAGKGKAPTERFVAAARELLESCEDAWRAHVETLASMSEYYFKCAEQVDKKLSSVLDEVESVLTGETDLAGFEGILKSMFKTIKIALVPTYLDCVFVGSLDSRFMGMGHVYILGATNDKLPSSSEAGAVLTPKDELALQAAGVNLTPDRRQKLLNEMYSVLDLMKKARGRLVLSYPEAAGGGRLRPSTVIAELKELVEQDGEPLCEQFVSFDSPSNVEEDRLAYLLLTKKSCYYEALGARGRMKADDRHIIGAAEVLSEADFGRVAMGELPPERIRLPRGAYPAKSTSVSRLESFFACPYSHFFKYVLSLSPRKDGKPQGTENGTVLHKVLELFFGEIRDGAQIAEEDIRERAYGYFDVAIRENGFQPLLERPETGRLLARLKEEAVAVCAELYKISKRSKFKPLLLEAKIGEGELSCKPLSGDIALKGIVDRVDTYGDYFTVIDYKTYKNPAITPTDLYYGRKLQLYIYMTAVRDSLRLKPAGVFYLPITSNYFSENDDVRYKFRGQTSDDESVLESLDEYYVSNKNECVIPVSMKRGGFNPETHLGALGFDAFGEYATRLAAEGAKQIAEGYIRPSPLEKCDMCDFCDICKFKNGGVRKATKPDVTVFYDEYNAQRRGENDLQQ